MIFYRWSEKQDNVMINFFFRDLVLSIEGTVYVEQKVNKILNVVRQHNPGIQYCGEKGYKVEQPLLPNDEFNRLVISEEKTIARSSLGIGTNMKIILRFNKVCTYYIVKSLHAVLNPRNSALVLLVFARRSTELCDR